MLAGGTPPAIPQDMTTAITSTTPLTNTAGREAANAANKALIAAGVFASDITLVVYEAARARGNSMAWWCPPAHREPMPWER